MRTIILLLLLSCLLAEGSPRGKAARSKRFLRMEATAFSKDSRPTSAGTVAHEGIVAADPSVLPLGSRIRVSDAAGYSGIYVVTDTGGKVQGMHIDVFIPSAAEAKQFGKKLVRVQLLQTGRGKEDARIKDGAASR